MLGSAILAPIPMEGAREGAGYVVLRATHATYLTLQLPAEVAHLIGYDWTGSNTLRSPGREVAFLARGPGFCRVISSLRSAALLPREIHLNRFIAPARVSRKRLFYLPVAVAEHLGLTVDRSLPTGRASTHDSVVWLVDARSYYRFRERGSGSVDSPEERGAPARVYLAKSLVPVSVDLDGLEAPAPIGRPDRLRGTASATSSDSWRGPADALGAVSPAAPPGANQ